MLGVYAVAGLTVLGHVAGPGHHHPTLDAVIDLTAAALLALLAIRSLLRHPTAAEGHQNRIMSRLTAAPGAAFLGFGAVAMLVNFSTLVLFLPALHQIARSSVALADKVVVGAVLVIVTLLPVLVPVLLVTALGPRADPLLARLNRLVGGHSRQITVGIAAIFAVVLVVKGIREIG
jgi:hypothetical protein